MIIADNTDPLNLSLMNPITVNNNAVKMIKIIYTPIPVKTARNILFDGFLKISRCIYFHP